MEVKMKRFIVAMAVFGFSILVAFTVIQATVKKDDTLTKLRPSHNELMKILNAGHKVVIPVPSVDTRKVAPVIDNTGSVVSDPSGTILNGSPSETKIVPVTGADRKVAPVFDTTGAVISDPSGILSNAVKP
jgi:hypothetical protein